MVPRKSRLAQIIQRPAGGLGGVVRLPDDRDRAGRQQRLAQGGAVGWACRHSDFREAKRRGRRYCAKFSRRRNLAGRPVARHAQVHNNVRIGGIPIWRAVAILSAAAARAARTFQGGEHMLKSFGIAPSRPRWSASAWLFSRAMCARAATRSRSRKTTTRACSTRRSTGPTTSSTASSTPRPAAVDAAKKGAADAERHRAHAGAVQGQARRRRQSREGRQRPLHQGRPDRLHGDGEAHRLGHRISRRHPQRRVGIPGLHGRTRRSTTRPSSRPASSATSRCRRRATSCSPTTRWRGNRRPTPSSRRGVPAPAGGASRDPISDYEAIERTRTRSSARRPAQAGVAPG